ncbi:flagellar basal-body MS-ring/collar protein FliF [Treponema sp. R80B11-R83G3]
MNEFFKKLLTKVTALWAGWSLRQKIIIAVIAVVIIGTVITLFRVSATPVLSAVISRPITDENLLNRIVNRIEMENVKVTVTPDNVVRVADDETARRMRVILQSEDLLPSKIDPWEIFDKERWTTTDMDRNVRFQRAQKDMIVIHLKAIEGIDNVELNIVWPQEKLFLNDQKPATAGLTIIPTPGSDITKDRKKIEGIQKLLKSAIEGLTDENITITDNYGNVLNDFEGLKDFDKQALTERQQKFLMTLEKKYRGDILTAIQKTFSEDRVRDLNVKFEMDMSKKFVDTVENFPVTFKPRTPGLSYDDSIIKDSLVRSSSKSDTKWEGVGFNPEGPAGVEGQTPPAFEDMDNLYGKMNQTTEVLNYEINQRKSQEEKSPQIDHVSVSVNIDGEWKIKYDAKRNPIITPDGTIEREYIPVPEKDLRDTEALIRDAILYNSARGDSVTVRNIPFDRKDQFKKEDEAFFRKKQMQLTIIVFIAGLTIMLFGFMLFRTISREMERRKRLAEEERARREQMLRESAMAEAEQEGEDVSISTEERTRMQLMESAINLAKEHPEDAAQLIRTWILEE